VLTQCRTSEIYVQAGGGGFCAQVGNDDSASVHPSSMVNQLALDRLNLLKKARGQIEIEAIITTSTKKFTAVSAKITSRMEHIFRIFNNLESK
jgi:hypothetical protein